MLGWRQSMRVKPFQNGLDAILHIALTSSELAYSGNQIGEYVYRFSVEMVDYLLLIQVNLA